MPKCAIGSIWTVPELGGHHAIVLLGPYTAGHPVPEYIVAPLYTGEEPGFGWTDQDVFVDERETSLGGVRYIGVWNARPVREGDLDARVGNLPEDAPAIALAQSVFWGTQDRTTRHSRLGHVRTPGAALINFHLGEMLRWRALTVRATQRVATATQKAAALRLARATASV
jgi:hypothetical protein